MACIRDGTMRAGSDESITAMRQSTIPLEVEPMQFRQPFSILPTNRLKAIEVAQELAMA